MKLTKKGWEALSLIAAENARLVENEMQTLPCATVEEIAQSCAIILRSNSVFIYQNLGVGVTDQEGNVRFIVTEQQSRLFRG